MRTSLLLLLACLALAAASAAPPPPELEEALQRLQTDSPRGWAFTQTTEAGDRSRVERYRAIGVEPERWELVAVDGQPPDADELEEYRKHQALRAGGGPAPNVKDQIRRDSAALQADDGTRAVWQFQLQPSSEEDTWAEHMVANFTLHQPTGTIEQVELVAPAPFSPMFGVNVQEARTLMRYSLPQDDRPSLLQEITVRVRGRAWLIRSLDSDMVVRYDDYRYVGKS